MAINKDGLESGQSVDFETMQKIKRNQRDGLKNAKPEPKRRSTKAGKREAGGQERPTVSDLPGAEEPKEAQ